MTFQLGRKSNSAFGSFTSHYGNTFTLYLISCFWISSSLLDIFLFCMLEEVFEKAKKSGTICDLRSKTKTEIKYLMI